MVVVNLTPFEVIQGAYRWLVENPDKWIKHKMRAGENRCAMGALALVSGVEQEIESFGGKNCGKQACGLSFELSILNLIPTIKEIYGEHDELKYIQDINDKFGYEAVLEVFEKYLADNVQSVMEEQKKLVEV